MRYRFWTFLFAVLLSVSVLSGCSGEKKKLDNSSNVPPAPGTGKSKPPAAPKVEK